MAPTSFSTLPLHILHCLADHIHPPDLLSFILTCKATSLLEVSGRAIRLHRERLSICRSSKSHSIDNAEELTLTDLLCKCIRNPWAGYYIEKLEILHGRDSWDFDWVESYPSQHQPDDDHYFEEDPQEVIRSYLRIQEIRGEGFDTDAAIAAATVELPTQHSVEQLELLEEAVLKADFIVDEEKLSWMEEIKLGSEVPIIALLLPRLTMLKELQCSDPLSLQRLNQFLHRITLHPSFKLPNAFRSLKKLYLESSAKRYSLITSVLPLMTLPALQELHVKNNYPLYGLKGVPTLRDEDEESANWALGSISPKLRSVELEYTKMSLTWFSRLLGSLKSLYRFEITGGRISDHRLIQYNGWIPNISESVSDLGLTFLEINDRSLALLLRSCHNLKSISLSSVNITSDISSDDIDKLDLEPQSSSLSRISLSNTDISLETLDTIIAFSKQLRSVHLRNLHHSSHVDSHLPIKFSPEEVVKVLQARASNTLHSLSLNDMKPINALSTPSLRDFQELSGIDIDECILFGKKETELYYEPEKQDAWLATLPPLSEILPASLESLKIFTKQIYPITTRTKPEILSCVRPWTIRLADHFEKNYASTPCLFRLQYSVYDRLHPLENLPEVDRLREALELRNVHHSVAYDIGGMVWCSRGAFIRERRKIIAPFESKITTAKTV